MVFRKLYLLSVEHFFEIHAGIKVYLIFRVFCRIGLDVVPWNFVLHLLAGIIDFRVVNYPYHRFSLYYANIPVNLRRHVMTQFRCSVAGGHIVKNYESVFRRLKPCKENIGVAWYSCLIEYSSETSKWKLPPFSLSSNFAKMEGESKSGKHNQSMLPPL